MRTSLPLIALLLTAGCGPSDAREAKGDRDAAAAEVDRTLDRPLAVQAQNAKLRDELGKGPAEPDRGGLDTARAAVDQQRGRLRLLHGAAAKLKADINDVRRRSLEREREEAPPPREAGRSGG